MYGLIWKDFLVLRKTLRLYVLFLLGYLGMALLGIFDLTFVTTFCVVILMILPISAFSYDEFARWDRYARTLPLSSRQIVGGRYLFVLLLLLVVAAIGAVSAVCSPSPAPPTCGRAWGPSWPPWAPPCSSWM